MIQAMDPEGVPLPRIELQARAAADWVTRWTDSQGRAQFDVNFAEPLDLRRVLPFAEQKNYEVPADSGGTAELVLTMDDVGYYGFRVREDGGVSLDPFEVHLVHRRNPGPWYSFQFPEGPEVVAVDRLAGDLFVYAGRREASGAETDSGAATGWVEKSEGQAISNPGPGQNPNWVELIFEQQTFQLMGALEGARESEVFFVSTSLRESYGRLVQNSHSVRLGPGGSFLFETIEPNSKLEAIRFLLADEQTRELVEYQETFEPRLPTGLHDLGTLAREPVPSLVAGRVLDLDGNGVPGLVVFPYPADHRVQSGLGYSNETFWRSDLGTVSMKTDEDGVFRIYGPCDFEDPILLASGGRWHSIEPVRFEPGQTEMILRVGPAVYVECSVAPANLKHTRDLRLEVWPNPGLTAPIFVEEGVSAEEVILVAPGSYELRIVDSKGQTLVSRFGIVETPEESSFEAQYVAAWQDLAW